MHNPESVIDQVWQAWVQHKAKRLLLQLPIAAGKPAGKTSVYATIAQRFTDRGAPVVVLVHREELLLPLQQALATLTGTAIGLIKTGQREHRGALIQVASMTSLLNRQLPPAALVIVDEAHHFSALTYTQLFDQFPEAAILGVTATPVRLDGQGFREVFDRLIVSPAIATLITQGYLSPYRLYAAVPTVATQPVSKMGGDYHPHQLAIAVEASLSMNELIAAWQTYAAGLQTVVFAVTAAQSQAIATAYQAAGIPAAHLDSLAYDVDRQATIERFQRREIQVLTNCGLLSDGLAITGVEAVQCVRPTQSLALWWQMLGCALQVESDSDKERAIIIDHTDNWRVHGLPDRPLPWRLAGFELPTAAWAVTCPHCRGAFRPIVPNHPTETPTTQKLRGFEWCTEHQEFKPILQDVCPHCGQSLEIDPWQGEGEPPQPRLLASHLFKEPHSEIWDVPTDCRVEVLMDLYELVGVQRRLKRQVRLQWLTDRLTQKHPNLGIPELRECAKLAGMQEDWAIDWAQDWLQRSPQPSHLPQSITSSTTASTSTQIPAQINSEHEPQTVAETAISGNAINAIAENLGASLTPTPQAEPSRSQLQSQFDTAIHAEIHSEILNSQPSQTSSQTPSQPQARFLPGAQLPQLPNASTPGYQADFGTGLGTNSPMQLQNSRSELSVNLLNLAYEPTQPQTTRHQVSGKFGLWWVLVTITPDPDQGCWTKIWYQSPTGEQFEEQISGYLPLRYRRGVAELERRFWRQQRQQARSFQSSNAVASALLSPFRQGGRLGANGRRQRSSN